MLTLKLQYFGHLMRRVDSLDLRGFLELRRQWGFSPEARRESQGASRAVPGKSGLHARGEGASSRGEGLLFLPYPERNPESSLQTDEAQML